MWQKPWKYLEATAVGLGLTAVGIILQLICGNIEWDILAFPANLILVAFLIAALLLMHSLRHKVHLFTWLSGGPCAVISICFAAGLTMVMGLIRQAVSYVEIPGFIGRSGLRQMLSTWYFVLPYTWMTISLGMATLRVAASRWTPRTVPFIFTHLGLFLVLVCGVAGSADMKRLSMTAYEGIPEWRATDKTNPSGEMTELPLAIELNDFIMEEYPPKLMIYDLSRGIYLPEKHPVSVIVGEEDQKEAVGWTIRILEISENAALVAADSAEVHREGWVSCGSHLLPVTTLELGGDIAVVMPKRAPKRYASDVTIYVKDSEEEGHALAGVIEVNHPFTVNGWKIDQLGYDERFGNESQYSVFEIVRDPWLPAVYVGLIMMLAGAVSLFLTAPGRIKKEEEQL